MSLGLAGVPALLIVPFMLRAGDASALPLRGRGCVIAFEDLQCPDCADAEALLEEASAKYGIPLVRRDFPLPKHDWSFEAHVLARYFDTQTDTQTGTKTGTQTGTKSDAKAAANALPLGEQFRRWVTPTRVRSTKATCAAWPHDLPISTAWSCRRTATRRAG